MRLKDTVWPRSQAGEREIVHSLDPPPKKINQKWYKLKKKPFSTFEPG
jgi:hypothetical protein